MTTVIFLPTRATRSGKRAKFVGFFKDVHTDATHARGEVLRALRMM